MISAFCNGCIAYFKRCRNNLTAILNYTLALNLAQINGVPRAITALVSKVVVTIMSLLLYPIVKLVHYASVSTILVKEMLTKLLGYLKAAVIEFFYGYFRSLSKCYKCVIYIPSDDETQSSSTTTDETHFVSYIRFESDEYLKDGIDSSQETETGAAEYVAAGPSNVSTSSEEEATDNLETADANTPNVTQSSVELLKSVSSEVGVWLQSRTEGVITSVLPGGIGFLLDATLLIEDCTLTSEDIEASEGSENVNEQVIPERALTSQTVDSGTESEFLIQASKDVISHETNSDVSTSETSNENHQNADVPPNPLADQVTTTIAEKPNVPSDVGDDYVGGGEMPSSPVKDQSMDEPKNDSTKESILFESEGISDNLSNASEDNPRMSEEESEVKEQTSSSPISFSENTNADETLNILDVKDAPADGETIEKSNASDTGEIPFENVDSNKTTMVEERCIPEDTSESVETNKQMAVLEILLRETADTSAAEALQINQMPSGSIAIRCEDLERSIHISSGKDACSSTTVEASIKEDSSTSDLHLETEDVVPETSDLLPECSDASIVNEPTEIIITSTKKVPDSSPPTSTSACDVTETTLEFPEAATSQPQDEATGNSGTPENTEASEEKLDMIDQSIECIESTEPESQNEESESSTGQLTTTVPTDEFHNLIILADAAHLQKPESDTTVKTESIIYLPETDPHQKTTDVPCPIKDAELITKEIRVAKKRLQDDEPQIDAKKPRESKTPSPIKVTASRENTVSLKSPPKFKYPSIPLKPSNVKTLKGSDDSITKQAQIKGITFKFKESLFYIYQQRVCMSETDETSMIEKRLLMFIEKVNGTMFILRSKCGDGKLRTYNLTLNENLFMFESLTSEDTLSTEKAGPIAKSEVESPTEFYDSLKQSLEVYSTTTNVYFVVYFNFDSANNTEQLKAVPIFIITFSNKTGSSCMYLKRNLIVPVVGDVDRDDTAPAEEESTENISRIVLSSPTIQRKLFKSGNETNAEFCNERKFEKLLDVIKSVSVLTPVE